ncbi:MAG: response regulator, partial [Thermoanaerobaculia bacterium]|nr:response regulator [Thermoanaerobaculia bacterium]
MNASARTESDLRLVRTSLPSRLLHDLRTPLNQIIGYSEMLAEDETREGIVTDLQRIRSAGRRMLALIDENFSADGEIDFIPSRTEVAERGLELDRPESPVTLGMTGAIAPGSLLIVDDDETNRDVLKRRLTHQGHTVVTATSGSEALQQMRENSFDLVLLDIMMPDMDGYEVLGRIKGDVRLRNVPVIMISALSDVQSVVRCIEAGAEDYLSK